MKENVSIMRFLEDYIENCLSFCGLYYVPFNPRMVLFLISNQSSPSKCSFHFQHSCFHSVAQVKNLTMILSSLFLSPATSNPLASLDNSTFELNLQSAPAAILPSSFTQTTEWVSSLACFHFSPPLCSIARTIRLVLWKGKSGHVTVLCLNQPCAMGPHLPFQPWVRPSLAHSLCPVTPAGLGTEQDSFPSQGFAVTLPLPSTRPFWFLSMFRSQLKCLFPRVAHWSRYQKLCLHHSLSLYLVLILFIGLITNYAYFSKRLLLSFHETDCSAEPCFLICCCTCRTQRSAWQTVGVQ